MTTSIEITQSVKNSYDSFIARFMASTGLPFSEMQTLTEWVENRYNDFTKSSPVNTIQGFENWLSKKYN